MGGPQRCYCACNAELKRRNAGQRAAHDTNVVAHMQTCCAGLSSSAARRTEHRVIAAQPLANLSHNLAESPLDHGTRCLARCQDGARKPARSHSASYALNFDRGNNAQLLGRLCNGLLNGGATISERLLVRAGRVTRSKYVRSHGAPHPAQAAYPAQTALPLETRRALLCFLRVAQAEQRDRENRGSCHSKDKAIHCAC